MAVDKKKVLTAVTQISDAMTRVEAERDFINDTVKKVAEEQQLEKKLVRKLARVYHKQNFANEKASAEEFVQTYDSVCK